MKKAEAIELFRYTDWANTRVFDALDALEDEQWTREIGGSFGSIRATAAHLISADWIWLERWNGRSPKWPPAWVSEEALPELRQRMQAIASERLDFLSGLPEGDIDRIVEYGLMNGTPDRRSLGELLRHVANHATYHRGQLVMMLRMAGAKAPGTDMILWFRDHAD